MLKDLQCNKEYEGIFGKMFGESQYSSPSEAHEECLKEKGYIEHFPKAEARILFKEKAMEGIQEVLVARFSNAKENQHLYRQYQSDIGNCLNDWDQWQLADILIKFFVFYPLNNDQKIQAFMELSKITEYRPIIARYVYRYLN